MHVPTIPMSPMNVPLALKSITMHNCIRHNKVWDYCCDGFLCDQNMSQYQCCLLPVPVTEKLDALFVSKANKVGVMIFFLLTVGVDYSSKELCVPRTVTCCVGSGETHTALASLMLALHNQSQDLEERMLSTADHNCINKHPSHLKERRSSTRDVAAVLAGLHACGDLSATMLRYLPVVLSPPPFSLSLSIFTFIG